MIQLRPQISLKIDKISKDGICIRIFGWFLFYTLFSQLTFIQIKLLYVILQIMMIYFNKNHYQTINNRKKYLSYDIRLSKFELEDKQNEYKNLNYTNATGKYTFPIQNISEIELNLNVTINKNEYYDLEHVMVKEEEILNDIKYQLIVHSEDQILVLNETHSTSLKCKSKSEQIQCTGYLESIINNGYKDLQFQLFIFHHNALAIHTQTLTLLYENNQYYTMILIFQVLFLFLILYGIYYFFSNLSDYPKQMWPKIHQWLLVLLIGMILYNFPILLIRNQYGQFVHYYQNLVELFIQSGLFYFWLSIFELEQTQTSEDDGQINQNQFSIWNLLKLLLVILYTVPQAFMDTFIFIMQEELMQYDPRIEIPFYNSYLKFVIISLIGYSICYLFLLYKSFNRYEKSILIQSSINLNLLQPNLQLLKMRNNMIHFMKGNKQKSQMVKERQEIINYCIFYQQSVFLLQFIINQLQYWSQLYQQVLVLLMNGH